MKLPKHLLLITVISIIAGISLPTSVNFSQSQLRLYDEPGGGGDNNTPTQSSSSDKTFIYVAGGALLVGIVVYGLLRDKKKEKEVDADTSSAANDYIFEGISTATNYSDVEMERTKDALPINIVLGIRKEQSFISDNTYMVGIGIKF